MHDRDRMEHEEKEEKMGAEGIITLVILSICALPMVGLGIAQIRSRKPVGFWSGKRPPSAEDVTDVAAYNRKHGVMWIIYGLGSVIAFCLGMLLGGEWWPAILMMVEIMGGLVLMILFHDHLDRVYVKRKE